MPKIFHSEHVYSYQNYTFGYATYAQREQDESIDQIYDLGFLPYSGDAKSDKKDLYYMARSARIDLSTFSLSSENRRIRKKFEDKKFSISKIKASEFLKNREMIDFCLSYFIKRHGENVMSEERFLRILSYSPETHLIEYKDENKKPAAYVIEIQGTDISHYWFSFFDLDLAYSSFGMWLMIDRTENAKNEGKKYYYLGTVYNDKALYKTNIPAIEFWNGQIWSNDVKHLKLRAHTDASRTVSQTDEFKQEQ